MPLVRAPSNENQAASYAMLGALRLAIAFAVWGSVLASLLPSRVYFPLRILNRLFSQTLRRQILIAWHVCAAIIAGAMATTLLGGWHLHVRRNGIPSLRAFLCQKDALAGTYADNRLVAALTLLLFCLYARMFVDRGVAVLCGARSASLLTRIARSVNCFALWWLVSEGSTLALPLAVSLALDWCTSRIADALKLRKSRAAHRFELVHTWTSLLGALALAHMGGQAFPESCSEPKRNGSLVTVHALLWAAAQSRELLKRALDAGKKEC